MTALPLRPDAAVRTGAVSAGEVVGTHASVLREWLCRDALPLWARCGVDLVAGGFHEQLDRSARPVDEPRRTRVVARQVYVFATAQRHGWWPDAGSLVDHGLRFLFGPLQGADGLFRSAVRPDGTVVRAEFDLYEQAFALFAMAVAYAADPRRAELPGRAAATLDVLRRRYGHAEAGFHEASPRTVPLRSNPHMHLLEAALAWCEVPNAPPVWSELACELAALCQRRFIDSRSGAVREYFDADWSPMPGDRGRVVEPGHQFEWSWLLTRWAHLGGPASAAHAARRLVEIGETHGVDAERNVAVNELDDRFDTVDAAAKLWPQTERLKAWCARAEFGEGAEIDRALARIGPAARGLAQYLRHETPGLWTEVIAGDGRALGGHARASSLYHIVCAIETVCGTARRLQGRA